MKLKGISILEQHVEKLVLLVFALFAIGVFVMQFDIMGDPNAVKIDNQSVPPDRAVDVVKDKALRLKGQMEGKGDRVDIPPQPGALKVVKSMLNAPVAAEADARLDLAREWSPEAGYNAPTSGSAPDIPLGSPYMEVKPPAPTDVMARAFAGTIDPVEPIRYPKLAPYLPAEQPLDKRAVTVQATFDAAGLRSMLGTAPEDQTVNPLPTTWWQGRVEILDVELIRQQVYDDGTMGGEETVGALPGRFSLRDTLRASDTAPKDLPQILAGEAQHREEIRRPAYYNMIMGEPWVWPAKAAEMSSERPNAKDINRLVSQYRQLAQEKERIEKALKKLGQDYSSGSGGTPRPSRSQVWPTIPATWLAQMPPPGPGRGGGSDQDEAEKLRQQRKKRQIKGLEDRMAELTKQMDQIAKQLSDTYEVGVDGKPLKPPTIEAFTGPLTSLTGPDATDTVTVWTHDISVEPGASYRYRLRVWVTNPLFGHVGDVPDSQHDLAARPAIASADSAWSNVVHTYPERVFFVAGATEASAGGQLGLERTASASVDVYEFYYGFWRGGSVSLDQGDQIRVDLTLPELPIFDVEQDEQGNPVVKGSTNLPTTKSISEGAMLLEVGVGYGAGDRGEVHQAIFGRLDGDLEIRVAEADAESPLANAVWTSAEASKTAEVRQPGTAPGATPSQRTPGQTPGPEPMPAPRGRGRQPTLSPGGG